MEKILKFMKTRYFISGFIILLEFAQLLIVFGLLYKYSIIMSILGLIFYIGVFLYIINKYESPEFKLPWIIIIMLFFVIGAFIFILLSGNEENNKAANKFKKNKEKIKPCLKQDNTLEKLKEENMDAYLQANYIKLATDLPCYKNTKVTYYKLGQDFHESLLESLKEAKEFIFMEYFIIEEGKMWNPILDILKEKSESGVKVYVIYDDFGCISTLDEKYYEKLNKMGINSIVSNKFKPVMSRIHNNRDHRKITVIDGIVGFTGGVNLADEYINEKVVHGHWKDTAVKLEGEAVNSLTALFLETWNTQSKELLNSEKFMNKEYKKINTSGVVSIYGDGPEEFYKDNVGKYVYLNMLSAAKKYVYITTPYLICDYEILNALCICAKKGVDVRIITPHIPDKKIVIWMTQSNYETLIKSGVKIYEYTPGFIHAKNFICDDMYATCGTVNLDYRSLVHHFECGTWMYNTKCIKDMKEDFEKTLDISEEITLKKSKLKGLKKLIAEILKVFSPLF
ncbi:MAG: cardiolipin synthase [Bacilli bacterium]|nr:cardiolipin synthase [Bacilli bacterium]